MRLRTSAVLFLLAVGCSAPPNVTNDAGSGGGSGGGGTTGGGAGGGAAGGGDAGGAAGGSAGGTAGGAAGGSVGGGTAGAGDAGPSDDGGATTDAGSGDAGSTSDAGADAGAEFDGGVDAGQPDSGCAPHVTRAATVPIDVVWVMDTSGSMQAEIAQVNQHLGEAFANRLTGHDVDLRVIMLAARGITAFQVCLTPPLGGPSCGEESPLFFPVSQTVSSTNALSLILSTYDSANPALNWSGLLRPGALRAFVVVTDDNSALSALSFDTQLLAKLPAGTFGSFGTPPVRNYVFHSIIGVTAGSPSVVCPTAVNVGAQYQTLSNLTGGLRLPVCDADYQSNLHQLADALASRVACDLLATTATAAAAVDAGTVSLRLSPDGGALAQVASAAQCTGAEWYYDDNVSPTRMTLCPAACALARDAGGVELVSGCVPPRPAGPGPAAWVLHAGDVAAQLLHALAVDADGGVVVAGELYGTADLGGGSLTSAGMSDVVVAKLAPGGGHVWSRRFGSATTQAAHAVAVDPSGNIAVAGYFQGTLQLDTTTLTTAGLTDIFVASLDPQGVTRWALRFGGTTDDQLALAVATDPNGDVFIGGSFTGTMTVGATSLVSAGGSDAFVAKLSSAGTVVWARRFGDAAIRQRVRALATDAAGNLVLAGEFEGAVDFGGGVIISAGREDVFVAKLDASGGHVWTRRFGDGASQLARAAAVDGSGNVVVAGTFQGSVDFGGGPRDSRGGFDGFVLKLSSAGAYLSSAQLGGDGDDALMSVSAAGGVVTVAGHVVGPGTPLATQGGRDVFVARLSAADLSTAWAQRYGDAAFHQSAAAVAVDAAGATLLAGHFAGTVDFGSGVRTSAGSADLFVVALPP